MDAKEFSRKHPSNRRSVVYERVGGTVQDAVAMGISSSEEGCFELRGQGGSAKLKQSMIHPRGEDYDGTVGCTSLPYSERLVSRYGTTESNKIKSASQKSHRSNRNKVKRRSEERGQFPDRFYREWEEDQHKQVFEKLQERQRRSSSMLEKPKWSCLQQLQKTLTLDSDEELQNAKRDPAHRNPISHGKKKISSHHSAKYSEYGAPASLCSDEEIETPHYRLTSQPESQDYFYGRDTYAIGRRSRQPSTKPKRKGHRRCVASPVDNIHESDYDTPYENKLGGQNYDGSMSHRALGTRKHHEANYLEKYVHDRSSHEVSPVSSPRFGCPESPHNSPREKAPSFDQLRRFPTKEGLAENRSVEDVSGADTFLQEFAAASQATGAPKSPRRRILQNLKSAAGERDSAEAAFQRQALRERLDRDLEEALAEDMRSFQLEAFGISPRAFPQRRAAEEGGSPNSADALASAQNFPPASGEDGGRYGVGDASAEQPLQKGGGEEAPFTSRAAQAVAPPQSSRGRDSYPQLPIEARGDAAPLGGRLASPVLPAAAPSSSSPAEEIFSQSESRAPPQAASGQAVNASAESKSTDEVSPPPDDAFRSGVLSSAVQGGEAGEREESGDQQLASRESTEAATAEPSGEDGFSAAAAPQECLEANTMESSPADNVVSQSGFAASETFAETPLKAPSFEEGAARTLTAPATVASTESAFLAPLFHNPHQTSASLLAQLPLLQRLQQQALSSEALRLLLSAPPHVQAPQSEFVPPRCEFDLPRVASMTSNGSATDERLSAVSPDFQWWSCSPEGGEAREEEFAKKDAVASSSAACVPHSAEQLQAPELTDSDGCVQAAAAEESPSPPSAEADCTWQEFDEGSAATSSPPSAEVFGQSQREHAAVERQLLHSTATTENSESLQENPESQENSESVQEKSESVQEKSESVQEKSESVQENSESVQENSESVQENSESVQENSESLQENSESLQENSESVQEGEPPATALGVNLKKEDREDEQVQVVAVGAAQNRSAHAAGDFATACKAPLVPLSNFAASSGKVSRENGGGCFTEGQSGVCLLSPRDKGTLKHLHLQRMQKAAAAAALEQSGRPGATSQTAQSAKHPVAQRIAVGKFFPASKALPQPPKARSASVAARLQRPPNETPAAPAAFPRDDFEEAWREPTPRVPLPRTQATQTAETPQPAAQVKRRCEGCERHSESLALKDASIKKFTSQLQTQSSEIEALREFKKKQLLLQTETERHIDRLHEELEKLANENVELLRERKVLGETATKTAFRLLALHAQKQQEDPCSQQSTMEEHTRKQNEELLALQNQLEALRNRVMRSVADEEEVTQLRRQLQTQQEECQSVKQENQKLTAQLQELHQQRREREDDARKSESQRHAALQAEKAAREEAETHLRETLDVMQMLKETLQTQQTQLEESRSQQQQLLQQHQQEVQRRLLLDALEEEAARDSGGPKTGAPSEEETAAAGKTQTQSAGVQAGPPLPYSSHPRGSVQEEEKQEMQRKLMQQQKLVAKLRAALTEQTKASKQDKAYLQRLVLQLQQRIAELENYQHKLLLQLQQLQHLHLLRHVQADRHSAPPAKATTAFVTPSQVCLNPSPGKTHCAPQAAENQLASRGAAAETEPANAAAPSPHPKPERPSQSRGSGDAIAKAPVTEDWLSLLAEAVHVEDALPAPQLQPQQPQRQMPSLGPPLQRKASFECVPSLDDAPRKAAASQRIDFPHPSSFENDSALKGASRKNSELPPRPEQTTESAAAAPQVTAAAFNQHVEELVAREIKKLQNSLDAGVASRRAATASAQEPLRPRGDSVLSGQPRVQQEFSSTGGADPVANTPPQQPPVSVQSSTPGSSFETVFSPSRISTVDSVSFVGEDFCAQSLGEKKLESSRRGDQQHADERLNGEALEGRPTLSARAKAKRISTVPTSSDDEIPRARQQVQQLREELRRQGVLS